jgi:hypothetical protein
VAEQVLRIPIRTVPESAEMREERFPVTTGPGLPIRQLAIVPDSLYSIVE